MTSSEDLEQLVLDIIKTIDYDLWKEIRRDEDEDNLVEQVSDLILDFIENSERDEIEDFDN